MNKRVLKIAGISIGALVIAVYALFLILPFCLNGILNSYSDEIAKMVEKSSGFKLKLEKMQIKTTPKLTAGFKIGHTEVALANNDNLLKADNFEIKLSLLPILLRNIELDKVSVENLDVNLKVKKNGKFLIEDFLPAPDKSAKPNEPMAPLPLNIKLSNHLPNIYVKNYNITFVDIPTDKKYSIKGNNVKVTDFVVNKKIKIAADGVVTLDNAKQFTYDINLFNKIMPDMTLNEMVFNPPQPTQTEQPEIVFNVMDVFKALYSNQLTANVKSDIKTSGSFEDVKLDGYFIIDGLTLAVDGKKLPAGNLNMDFVGNKINMISKLYTAETELTEISGDFKTGKKPKIDLTFKSNAGLNNVFNILDSIAKSFGINDLATISATGAIDANFNIKSNLKKVKSSGYFKIPSATVNYALYKVMIDQIKADVDFSNNKINIKDVSFMVLDQPLRAYGTIKNDTTSDLHLTADKLLLKALITAAGQVAILKDNDIRSGTLSMDATLKGKLSKPIPSLDLSIDNVNIKNKPSNTSVTLANTIVTVSTDGKKYDGVVDLTNLLINNPMAKIKAPKAKVSIGEKDININNAYILLNNSRIDITGKITDYLNKKIAIDIKANGNLLSNDLRAMIPADLRKDVKALGKLPLAVTLTGNDKTQNISVSLSADPSNYLSILDVDALRGKSTLIKSDMLVVNDNLKFSNTGVYANGANVAALTGSVNNLSKSQTLNLNVSTPSIISMGIPGFKNSKLSAKGNISISGSALNPILKGQVSVPALTIPEMMIAMNNLEVSLNGVVANGKGSLKKFVSGGIVAENLSSDFSLINNVFYLKNISGDAFSGKINGNVSYNILNGFVGVDFKGSGMSAVRAIEGAAGIKNALSGTLGFNAKITTSGATDVQMMKNLKGNVSFNIDNGTLGNLGRLENLLSAQNITANSIMRAALAPITSLSVIKNTSNFKYITGDLSFNNGWANIKSIKTSGHSMAYYITGRYNLINGTANLVILGRLGSDVVKVLGPLGDLSVQKLTSYIPKFGALTGNLINAMTTNPKGENTSAIPPLSGGNAHYKDFKVSFNGGIESKSSVKSFKWLSNPDLSGLPSQSIKEQIQGGKDAIKNDIQGRLDAVKAAKEASQARSQQAQKDYRQQSENLKNNVNDLKNMFKF